jgi:transcriptional regulator with XRE-family HTH domain
VISGQEIRARREALGLTVLEVERGTHIPGHYIQALEEDRHADLPGGPYAALYTRTVCTYLGIELAPDPDLADSQDARVVQSAPLWFVRGTAAIALLVLGVMLGTFAWELFGQPFSAPPVDRPLQLLELRTNRDRPIEAWVDGTKDSRTYLMAATPMQFRGHTIEVSVEAVEGLDIRWNNARIEPQGAGGDGRLLRFVDDGW